MLSFFKLFGGIMALVKFGAGISEMRGKEGGVIYSRNAYGSYIKTKVSPVNPQTAHQLSQRTLMGNLAQSWMALTGAKKAGWDSLGAQVTRINRFGDSTAYTGFSLYMRLNRNLVLASQPAIDDAPLSTGTATLTLGAITIAVTGPVFTIAYNPTPTSATDALAIYATPNMVTGRRFVKNFYRLINVVAPAAGSPQSIYTEYTAYYGTAPLEDATIFIKAKFINIDTGFDSVIDTASAVVAG
jgi:hypothetical protein